MNIGSNSWWEAGGGFPAYTTAKSAVHGLTRTMARDLGGHRIRVNAIVPGWIMTERQKELWVTPEALEKHLDDRAAEPDQTDGCGKGQVKDRLPGRGQCGAHAGSPGDSGKICEWRACH